MSSPGWVDRDEKNGFEVQENIYTGELRHRPHIPFHFFGEWTSGEPPEKGHDADP